MAEAKKEARNPFWEALKAPIEPMNVNPMNKTKTMGRRRIWISALVLALCALIVLFAANAGRMLVVNAPQPADLILVLAGETGHRPARAIELLKQGYANHIVMDVPTGEDIYGFTVLELAESYVNHLPPAQAAAVRICPIVGLSTREETRDVETCLTGEKGTRILIVTSDFHTGRALSIFRHEIHGKSFSVAAAYDDAQFGTQWWTHRQWAKTFLEEWMRVLWWNVVDRWR